ncbi:hypothetical protein DENIS_4133 [Desulfonema ishimotonii]|uniref:Uncharacterized protein n=1 Tax=Desulfonema ishimotonii TaxID=45657 RepID=A0A401G1P4_9BACT|nr:hypothetical protein [Desulfonema ishimotonii]GBC63140.1 hypothetical protein DENIS_4133 [Desulfonema ishimotonii]
MFQFIKRTLLQWLSGNLLMHPAVVNFLIRIEMAHTAATLINNKFDRLAPGEERTASCDYFRRKWAFFDAARFLLQCGSTTTAAIFTRFFEDAELNAAHKPGAIVNLWFTHDAFQSDEALAKKATDISSVVAKSHKALITDILKSMSSQGLITFLDKVRIAPADKALMGLPPEATAYGLHRIRESDPDRFDAVVAKFSPEYAADVKDIVKRMDAQPFPRMGGRQPETEDAESSSE